MGNTARIYLDESKLFSSDQYPQLNPEPEMPRINHAAVQWYEDYFHKMMQHHTIEVTLRNGIRYFVFSEVPAKEWVDHAQERSLIQATRYLDAINMEEILIQNVLSVRDVTEQVRFQYDKQKELIFKSYRLVEEIMEYEDTPFVEAMIDYVLISRKDDESKRKFWRVVNEKYYGLDIHPLMEYEEDELQKILYYCENPEEQKALKWRPMLKNGAITAGTVLAGWLSYMSFFG